MVASDGRYHINCKRDFFPQIQRFDEREEGDVYLLEVINTVKAERRRIWNSVELYNLYTFNQQQHYRYLKTFIKNLCNYIVGALVSFHARRGAVVKRVEHISTSGAGSSPADSVGRDLNLQKLHY